MSRLTGSQSIKKNFSGVITVRASLSRPWEARSIRKGAQRQARIFASFIWAAVARNEVT